MRSWPPSLLLLVSVAGVALVADAIRTGGATLTLVLIVPIVSGRSLELLGGVGLIFLGLLSWALESGARSMGTDEGPPRSAPSGGEGRAPGSMASGGVVLIGPIPIFFGGYRPGTGRARWAWVALGVGLTLAVWAALVALVYFR